MTSMPLALPAETTDSNVAADDLRHIFQQHVRDRSNQVPPLGEGCSWTRFRYLRDIARKNLSLARLLEGHLDATAILHEAGRPVDDRLTYAIWASGGPGATTRVKSQGSSIVLRGSKPFCSGADLVDRALVHTDFDPVLVEVDFTAAGGSILYDRDNWCAPAFAGTHTWTTEFHDVPLAADAQIGEPGWYFKRAGFWQGAIGPATCWAGGAIGLVDYARKHCRKQPHACAHLGALLAAERNMNSSLKCAAEEIDRDPENSSGEAYPRALAVRHTIERECQQTMDHFGRMFGPRPLAYDAHMAQHYAELTLYIRQCHAERDLQELGEHALAAAP